MKKAKRAFSLKKGRYVNHNQTVLHMFRKKDISVITLQVMLKNILLLSSQLHIICYLFSFAKQVNAWMLSAATQFYAKRSELLASNN